MQDIYQKLARHLDNLPSGFPPTESGVELRILKRLFSPEEAEIATGLTMRQEEAGLIATRLGMSEEDIAPKLEAMSRKGLIFRKQRGGRNLYMAAQFVIGIWEYHVNDLDQGLVRDFNEYVPHLMKNLWGRQKTRQLRVIPVNRSVPSEMNIMSYERAEEIIRQQSKIVVAPCICRREHRMAGSGCNRPEEMCLIFSGGAYYYEQNGLGREISQEDALEILRMGFKAGLVLQPSNARKTANICLCCGCCCQVLKNLKSLPEPAKAVHTNYYAEADQENCTACGVCAERCQMEAIGVKDVAMVDLNRCIGCGLCVPTCEYDAMHLRQKKDSEFYEPPKHLAHTYINIAKERGKFKL